VYVCTDPAAHGHADRYPTTLSTGRAAGPMTEAQKAERREVIANNKAWDSAETVRRDWLTQFLTRRTPPKDAQQFIAATLAGGSHEVRDGMHDGHALALQLLSLDTGRRHPYDGPHPVAQAAAKASPNRAAMLTLGLLLGGLEQSLDRNTWRNPSPAAVAYLTTLSQWGYPLSDVERLAVQPGRARSDDAEHDDEGLGDPGDDEHRATDGPHRTDIERDETSEAGGNPGHPAEVDTDVATTAA